MESEHSKHLNSMGDPKESQVILELIRYNATEHKRYNNIPIKDLLTHYKDGEVNWINLDGLNDAHITNSIGEYFDLHPLLLEDVTSDHQPKAEEYEDYLFFTMKMLYRIEGEKIDYEQISFVLGKNYIITFQEKLGDPFNSLRERLRQNHGVVRKEGADYLLYRFIDVVVNNYYTVLDAIGQQIENIEDSAIHNPVGDEFLKAQAIKKELIFLRKAIHPLRGALSKLLKGECQFIDQDTLRFYSDVYDHTIHLSDSLDTYRDLASGLMDICMNALNTRMNEVMKVLAIISTIFMPLTFIAGVYGMNFNHMPELRWAMGYPVVMVIMGVLVMIMIRYFKFKRWL